MTQDNNLQENVSKAESHERLPVPAGAERGQPYRVTSTRFIQDSKKKDLMLPQRFCTFNRMCEDDAVYNAIDVTNIHVVNAMSKGKVTAPTERGQVAADFLNYCIRNMTFGTWREAMTDASTDLKYGFSLLNIVTEVRDYGPYAGNRVLRKLGPRDQETIYGFLWDVNFREFRGVVQRPMTRRGRLQSNGFNAALSELNVPLLREQGFPIIRNQSLLHFTHDSTNRNPQGDSPLLHCYDAWAEKKLVERYETIGVSKDMGGIVVLRIPSELIEKANSDPNSVEAQEYKDLQADAASIQAGDSSYIVLTSDVDEDSKRPIYDFELKGLDGGGKQYSTSDIINQKRTAIYNCFGAGFLLLGQESTGSYALSSGARTTHEHYIQKIVNNKTDVINNQLLPRLLAVNNIFLDFEDMPVFKPANPNELDLEILGKFIQRTKSVGGLTREATEELYESAGLTTEGMDELVFDDGDTSRAGESQGSSGTGTSQDGGGASAVNSENGGSLDRSAMSINKNLYVDSDEQDHFIIRDRTTGESYKVDKEI